MANCHIQIWRGIEIITAEFMFALTTSSSSSAKLALTRLGPRMLLQPERDVAKAKGHRADFTTSLMAYAFAVHFDLGPEFKRHARTALADVAAAERDDARAMQKTISTEIGCLGSNMFTNPTGESPHSPVSVSPAS